MKKIEAIIQPFKLDEVKNALTELASMGLPFPRSGATDARKDTPKSIGARNTKLISSRRSSWRS